MAKGNLFKDLPIDKIRAIVKQEDLVLEEQRDDLKLMLNAIEKEVVTSGVKQITAEMTLDDLKKVCSSLKLDDQVTKSKTVLRKKLADQIGESGVVDFANRHLDKEQITLLLEASEEEVSTSGSKSNLAEELDHVIHKVGTSALLSRFSEVFLKVSPLSHFIMSSSEPYVDI
jgi:hypothetical protein